MNKDKLYQTAIEAAKGAYSPYSGFSVGAALLCDDGTVFTGCNIENAAYSVTVCAERVALFSAVAAGKRNFKAIAIVGAGKPRQSILGTSAVRPDNDPMTVRCADETFPMAELDFTEPCPPCGVCRQALSEFCAGDMPVILADGKGGVKVYRLDELLPLSFSKDNME